MPRRATRSGMRDAARPLIVDRGSRTGTTPGAPRRAGGH